MRKFLLILILVCCVFSVQAQESQVIVKLKNGATITGIIKELVATDHVTLIVSGVESKISMNDVSSIESIRSSSDVEEVSTKSPSKIYGEYEIQDSMNYPESITVNVGEEKIEMVLIRGGWFNMGYDDRHSLSMKSEPVHQVNLTSFYISKHPLSDYVVKELMAEKNKGKSKGRNYSTARWEKANEIVQKLSKNKDLPFRLVSEAEWEYVSLMPIAKELFGSDKEFEWCSDFMGEYQPQVQTDPLGPESGKSHVYRSYNAGRKKWQRKFSSIDYDDFQVKPLIRLVIKAKFINNTNI